jgi:hypothetical protein
MTPGEAQPNQSTSAAVENITEPNTGGEPAQTTITDGSSAAPEERTGILERVEREMEAYRNRTENPIPSIDTRHQRASQVDEDIRKGEGEGL